eukprot:364597-Chlamydomonas_euryale.AAC.1
MNRARTCLSVDFCHAWTNVRLSGYTACKHTCVNAWAGFFTAFGSMLSHMLVSQEHGPYHASAMPVPAAQKDAVHELGIHIHGRAAAAARNDAVHVLACHAHTCKSSRRRVHAELSKRVAPSFSPHALGRLSPEHM